MYLFANFDEKSRQIYLSFPFAFLICHLKRDEKNCLCYRNTSLQATECQKCEMKLKGSSKTQKPIANVRDRSPT